MDEDIITEAGDDVFGVKPVHTTETQDPKLDAKGVDPQETQLPTSQSSDFTPPPPTPKTQFTIGDVGEDDEVGSLPKPSGRDPRGFLPWSWFSRGGTRKHYTPLF